MADEVLSQEEIEALINQSGMGGSDAPAAGAQTSAPVADMASPAPPPQVEIAAGPAPTIEVKTSSTPSMNVRPMEFSPIGGPGAGGSKAGVDLILDVQLQVSVELGRSTMPVRDVLNFGPGSVVELDKHAGEPVEVVVNNKIIARGEVVVIDENFGVRITEIVSHDERNKRAKAA